MGTARTFTVGLALLSQDSKETLRLAGGNLVLSSGSKTFSLGGVGSDSHPS